MPNPLESASLPDDLAEAVAECIRTWADGGKVRRLWARDATLWTGGDEASWLGWLDIADDQLGRVDELRALAEDVARGRLQRRLLLGMGGSSLVPRGAGADVRRARRRRRRCTCWTRPTRRRSRAVESAVDLDARRCSSSSSKSGIDARAERLQAATSSSARGEPLGAEPRPASASSPSPIPGSKLEARRGATASARSSSACRRSAAATRRSRLRHGARRRSWASTSRRSSSAPSEMARACGPDAAGRGEPRASCSAPSSACWPRARPRQGHPRRLARRSHDLGAWLEQLIAESTGKGGKGVIPVDREPLGAPRASTATTACSSYLRLDSAPDAAQDAAVDALEAAGQPVVAHRRRRPSTSARSSSAGSSRRRSRARCSASTRSTSPTSRPARSRRAS